MSTPQLKIVEAQFMWVWTYGRAQVEYTLDTGRWCCGQFSADELRQLIDENGPLDGLVEALKAVERRGVK